MAASSAESKFVVRSTSGDRRFVELVAGLVARRVDRWIEPQQAAGLALKDHDLVAVEANEVAAAGVHGKQCQGHCGDGGEQRNEQEGANGQTSFGWRWGVSVARRVQLRLRVDCRGGC